MSEVVKILNEDGVWKEYEIKVSEKPKTIEDLIYWYVKKHNIILPCCVEDMTVDQIKILALQAIPEKYDEVLQTTTIKCGKGTFSCTESDIIYINALIDKAKEYEENNKTYDPVLQYSNGDCFISDFDPNYTHINAIKLKELESYKSRILERYLLIKKYKLLNIKWVKEARDKDLLLSCELAYSRHRETLLDM